MRIQFAAYWLSTDETPSSMAQPHEILSHPLPGPQARPIRIHPDPMPEPRPIRPVKLDLGPPMRPLPEPSSAGIHMDVADLHSLSRHVTWLGNELRDAVGDHANSLTDSAGHGSWAISGALGRCADAWQRELAVTASKAVAFGGRLSGAAESHTQVENVDVDRLSKLPRRLGQARSAMLGFDDVLDGCPEVFTDLADQWDRLADRVSDIRARWRSQVHDRLSTAAWSGPAKRVADEHPAQLGVGLSGHETHLRRVAGWLRQAGANFADAKARLTQARRQAARLGLVIDNNSVRVDPTRPSLGNVPATAAPAELLAREVSDALSQTNDADQRAAQALDRLTPAARAAEAATGGRATKAPWPISSTG